MSDPYTNHIIKVIVVQYAKKYGFSKISENSLNIIIEAVIDYVYKVSKLASESAAYSQRTETNILDLLFSLYRITSRHELSEEEIENESIISFREPETLQSLHQFLIKNDQIPKLDYSIGPYPKPDVSPFFENQKGKGTAFPFRTYVRVFSKKESPEVPLFYPDFPPEFTYKNVSLPSKNLISQIELDKRRSKEQKILQSQIENLMKDTATSEKKTITMQPHIVNLLGTGLTNEPVPDSTHPHLVFHGFSEPISDPENNAPSQLCRINAEVSLPAKGYISQIKQEIIKNSKD